jgi:hypothetical protein
LMDLAVLVCDALVDGEVCYVVCACVCTVCGRPGRGYRCVGSQWHWFAVRVCMPCLPSFLHALVCGTVCVGALSRGGLGARKCVVWVAGLTSGTTLARPCSPSATVRSRRVGLGRAVAWRAGLLWCVVVDWTVHCVHCRRLAYPRVAGAPGLSYTTFNVTWSSGEPQPVTFTGVASSTTYTVNITNTGPVAGDEVTDVGV